MASTLNSDNGVVSGSAGLKSSADATGVLALQTNGTTAVTIDASQNVGVGTASPGAKLQVNGNTAQYSASIAVRTPPNQYEWGHSNTAGYGSVIGAETGSGVPFIAFSAGAGTTSNTYRTFGLLGVVLKTDNAGALLFFSATNANADNQTLTERARIASTGQMSTTNGAGAVALAYDARAWVNFNGTGTVAIRASGNVTSITDNGVGDYTVNFTTAMSDANYSVVASSSYSANAARGSVWAEPYAVSTSAARILTSSVSLLYDVVSVTAAIFR
jgi:uncharacterized protein (AIM24 family)